MALQVCDIARKLTNETPVSIQNAENVALIEDSQLKDMAMHEEFSFLAPQVL